MDITINREDILNNLKKAWEEKYSVTITNGGSDREKNIILGIKSSTQAEMYNTVCECGNALITMSITIFESLNDITENSIFVEIDKQFPEQSTRKRTVHYKNDKDALKGINKLTTIPDNILSEASLAYRENKERNDFSKMVSTAVSNIEGITSRSSFKGYEHTVAVKDGLIVKLTPDGEVSISNFPKDEKSIESILKFLQSL